MTQQTKVVRVPVRIPDEDPTLRKLKYKALDTIMREARYLGNMAIRYTIAYRLKDIPGPTDPDTGQDVAVDTHLYRLLARETKFIPKAPLATLGSKDAPKMVRNADKDAWAGRKSLPTYRAEFVPFRSQGTKIRPLSIDGAKQFEMKIGGFASHQWLSDELIVEVNGKPEDVDKKARQLRLVSCFSWKDQGHVEVVQRIVDGDYKLCDSQLKRGKKGLMAFLVYKFTPVREQLDTAKVCGIDLGYKIPVACALNTGPQRNYLGDGDDVWAARAKFRAERRRRQRREGTYSKTRKWKRSEKEDNWIHTYYHAITRGVIKFCLQHGCGKIHMEDLSALRKADLESNEFRRLIWVPSKFAEMLQYKADEAGIALVKVNPRNTSRRCSECGHIARENRTTQANFKCVACGAEMNADYNAARNLARADGDVIANGYLSETSDALRQMDNLWEAAPES